MVKLVRKALLSSASEVKGAHSLVSPRDPERGRRDSKEERSVTNNQCYKIMLLSDDPPSQTRTDCGPHAPAKGRSASRYHRSWQIWPHVIPDGEEVGDRFVKN